MNTEMECICENTLFRQIRTNLKKINQLQATCTHLGLLILYISKKAQLSRDTIPLKVLSGKSRLALLQ
jgi:hypothetical protein